MLVAENNQPIHELSEPRNESDGTLHLNALSVPEAMVRRHLLSGATDQKDAGGDALSPS